MKYFCSLSFILSLLLNNKNADAQKYYKTEVSNPLVSQNIFTAQSHDTAVPATFEDVRFKVCDPIDHLNNPKEFNCLHRVPTLSADDSGFNPNGGYWRGGVMAPTTYMVLNGLNKCHKDSLANAIALNDLDKVVKVFNLTGMVRENYASDKIQGNDTKDLAEGQALCPSQNFLNMFMVSGRMLSKIGLYGMFVC
jgi:hypothetical protein